MWTKNGNNSRRLVVDDNSKQWQQAIINSQKQTGFEPTAVMDVNNCLYAFVITNAYFDKCKRLTLEVSTKPIDNLSKTVKKGVKTGVFNARFDIDSISSISSIINNPNISATVIGIVNASNSGNPPGL